MLLLLWIILIFSNRFLLILDFYFDFWWFCDLNLVVMWALIAGDSMPILHEALDRGCLFSTIDSAATRVWIVNFDCCSSAGLLFTDGDYCVTSWLLLLNLSDRKLFLGCCLLLRIIISLQFSTWILLLVFLKFLLLFFNVALLRLEELNHFLRDWYLASPIWVFGKLFGNFEVELLRCGAVR